MYLPRATSARLKTLFAHFPVVVVSGARQVGKSTLLRHLFPELPVVVFDPVMDVGAARKEPDLFLDNFSSPVILDEIQYVPELIPAVKRRVDRHRAPGMYLMTGSQQWAVMRHVADSLAGRAVFVDLEGFSLCELGGRAERGAWLSRWLENPEAFVRNDAEVGPATRPVYEQLWRGWLPEANRLPLDVLPSFFSAYIRTYIERDVRLLADTDDWQRFGRFVQLAAAMNACEINHSQFGRDIGISPQTARRWLALLQATFQWHEVPAFSGNPVKRVSGKPKGYLADTGIACHLMQVSSPAALAGHPQAGALFESAVLAEIRKACALESVPPLIHHWRSHGGAEVDVLLERDGRLYPLEIKLTMNPTRKDARGIEAFRAAHPRREVAPGLVVTPGLVGTDRALINMTERDAAISWQAF